MELCLEIFSRIEKYSDASTKNSWKVSHGVEQKSAEQLRATIDKQLKEFSDQVLVGELHGAPILLPQQSCGKVSDIDVPRHLLPDVPTSNMRSMPSSSSVFNGSLLQQLEENESQIAEMEASWIAESASFHAHAKASANNRKKQKTLNLEKDVIAAKAMIDRIIASCNTKRTC